MASALAIALIAGAASSPARAGDDGEAPIWSGIGATLGLGNIINKNNKLDTVIEYHEHGKLVVPPKMELPKPGAAGALPPAWPADQDLTRAKKVKALVDAPAGMPVGRYQAPIISPGDKVSVSTGATSGAGPGGGACLNDGHAVPCPDTFTGQKSDVPSTWWNFNPLTWMGVQKKPQTTLGAEPPRENLTEPPVGYRAPVEGVGAKVDN